MSILKSATVLGLAAVLAGCYMPDRAPHASLAISAMGALTFQGQAVAPQALQAAVRQAGGQGARLVVEIQTSPSAPIAAVEAAVQSIEAADARVAFAGATEAR